MEKSKKIKELNLFRGLAAIFIVLYHFTTRYNESFGHIKQPYLLNISYGYMAVAVFFILSGFLMAMKLNKEKSTKSFIKKRIVRLYPTYVVGMILTTVTLICFGGEEFSSRICSFKDWLINLTMMPAYLGAEPVDGVYWTLGIEIIFYILIACVIKFKKQKKIQSLSFFWIIISIIINVLQIFINNRLLKICGILLITEQVQRFIIGIIMYNIYKEDKINKTNYMILILCVINEYISQGIEYTLFLVFFSVIFYVIVCRKNTLPNIFNNKFINFISDISYPLYLTHQFIGYVIINKLEKIGLTNEVYIIIPIVIVITIAYLLHIFVEKRFNDLLIKDGGKT